MKIIDVHNHADYYGHNLEKMLENMDKYHIDITWLLSWECPPEEYDHAYDSTNCPIGIYPTPFERGLSYIERAPKRFILGYCPDPRLPTSVSKLKAAVGLYNVRVCGELKVRMMYDNTDALRLYRYCGKAGIPVLVHIDYELQASADSALRSFWYGGGIEAFERAIIACPETIFIGHAPGFWAHISGDEQYRTISYPKGKVQSSGKLLKMLDSYPNLYCDLSAGSGCNALQRDLYFAKTFLIEYQDRILYGRDYFDNVHQELLDSLELPSSVSEKIYGGNALRLVPMRVD